MSRYPFLYFNASVMNGLGVGGNAWDYSGWLGWKKRGVRDSANKNRYSYMYRDDSRSLAMSALSMGVWIGELTTHLRSIISGDSSVIYRHNVAHDGSLSKILSILQIDEMVWPGMGSEVVFELYSKGNSTTAAGKRRRAEGGSGKEGSGYFLRVLWKGQVLKSSNPTLGVMDMVPLETVLGYFDGLVGVGASLVKGKCDGTIPV